MLKFIVGIILLAVPFLLVNLFKDPFDGLRAGKKRGFVYILFFSIIFQTFLAISTQFFGVFYYRVILGANLLAVLILLVCFSLGNKLFSGYQAPCVLRPAKSSLPRVKDIDWIFFIVAIISVLTLYQVHYNYTGKFNMANDVLFQYREAKNMKYVYPYFSDEWYAVALVKESINNHSLPLTNPFDNSFFVNPEIVFHSFIAEIILFLGLDPLTQYTALSIFINTLIVLLAYLFLRINNVSKLVSAISSLSILYITSASNLPGIWNLIPVTLGVVLSLIGFCFLALSEAKPHLGGLASLAGVFVFLFYPPLFVFYGAALLAHSKKSRIFIILFFIVATLSVASLFFASGDALNYIFSNLFYRSFTGDFMPQFNFYDIMPWPIILLAVFGLYYVFKNIATLRNKKWLFFQLILGVIFWIFYVFSNYRIIIGYERAVFFTSIIVALISGFGIEEIKKYLSLRFEKIRPGFKYVEAGVVILFLFLILFYTERENWRKLILSNSSIQAYSIPMAPANNYLTDEDLRIFKNIKQKKFFSIPWKGTVIGVATNNYPVATKGGTITMDPKNPIIYQQFLDYNCEKKNQFAKDKNLDYVYSMPFLCSNFEKVDESSEGFVLYRFIWQE